MCVSNLVKIDWEMPAKNSRWPPRNLVFWHFNIRLRWFPAHHRDRLVYDHIIILVLSFSCMQDCHIWTKICQHWRELGLFKFSFLKIILTRRAWMYSKLLLESPSFFPLVPIWPSLCQNLASLHLCVIVAV